MSRLKGKSAFITGGSKSIGKSIAISFAKEGANVIIGYSSSQKAAEETANEAQKYNVKAYTLHSDLSNPSEIDQWLDFCDQKLGRLDVVVNNAGVLTRRDFLDVPEEELNYVTQINMLSPFILIQKAAKYMIKNSIQGSIINISSVSSDRAALNVSHYEASKAGLSMVTKSAAFNLAKHGIRVNEIAPGLTQTDINKQQWEQDYETWEKRKEMIPIGRAGKPEDHAGAAVFLASDESSWMTGGRIVIDGGVTTRL